MIPARKAPAMTGPPRCLRPRGSTKGDTKAAGRAGAKAKMEMGRAGDAGPVGLTSAGETRKTLESQIANKPGPA